MSLTKTALAAIAALSLLFATTTAPNVAFAAKDKQASEGKSSKKASKKSAKKSDAKKASKKSSKKVAVKASAKADAKKSSKSKSKKMKAAKASTSTKVVVKNDRDRRYVVRSTSQTAFVVIGKPVVYRAYGAGWCRALHRGRHWAPGLGWHAGRHVGRVRC